MTDYQTYWLFGLLMFLVATQPYSFERGGLALAERIATLAILIWACWFLVSGLMLYIEGSA